jgi:hypothetical protein
VFTALRDVLDERLYNSERCLSRPFGTVFGDEPQPPIRLGLVGELIGSVFVGHVEDCSGLL